MSNTELLDSIDTILKGSLIVLVGNLIGTGAGFATRIFAARYLGAADYGLIALGITVLNVTVLIALLGLDHGLATKMSDDDSPADLSYSALVSSMAVAIALSFVLVLFVDPITAILDEPGFGLVLLVFAVTVPILTYNRIIIGAFRGFQRTAPRVVIKNFGFQAVTLGAVVFGAWIGAETLGIALSWLAGAAVGAMAATMFLLRDDTLSVSKIRSPIPRRPLSIVGFSFPLMISDAVWMLMQQGDVILLGYFSTSVDIGVYDASYTLGRILLIFLGTVGFIFLPVLSSQSSREDDERLYRLTTKWTTFVTLPIFLVLVFFPGYTIEVIFGDSYSRGAVILPLLTTGFFIHLLVGQAGNALITNGHTRPIMYINTAGVVLNIAANVVLIPRFNILGATVATVASYTLVNLLYLYYLWSKIDVQPFYRAYLVPVAAASGAFIVLVWIGRRLVGDTYPILFAGTLVVFGLAYLPILYLTGGIEEDDLAVVRRWT
jgi:O-antigen/teichoic acid export membrane protein